MRTAIRVFSNLGFALSAVLCGVPLHAADGDLDPTFSSDGRALVLWDEDGLTFAEASVVAPLPDGSVVVGGTLGWDPPAAPLAFDWVMAKLSRSGVVDSGWGDSGRRRIAFDLAEGGGDFLHGLYAEPDGSVLAIGVTFDGQRQIPALARLTPEGDPDPTFGDAGLLYVPSPWPNSTLIWTASARQHDGKLLLAGYCLRCPSNTSHYNPFAVRFHADGTLDTSFSFDGWAPISDGGTTNDALFAVAATGDGRVLLGFEADGELRLARLNGIGGLDGTFGGDGFVDLDYGLGSYDIASLVVDPASDETYVVVNGTIFGGKLGLVDRRLANGSDDAAWGVDGGAIFSLEEGIELASATLQGDGKLIVAGWMDATGPQLGGFFLGRLDPDGQKDASFDGNGVARYEFDRTTNGEDGALAIALSGGKPVVGGYAYDAADETDMAILRVHNAYVFADGFEAGDTLSWSSSTP
jgi:uncharacterized delta-60 repeat protein